jgi:hypothetical protein
MPLPGTRRPTVHRGGRGSALHVTFTGGESEYSIGPDVPILANAPGDMSLLKARRSGLRYRLEETRRHRDRRPALCRKGQPPM